MRFMKLIWQVDQKKPKYLINRFVLELGILLRGYLSVKNQWGLRSQEIMWLVLLSQFFKRIGKAGTKIKVIEENDNGQGNRSMVN